jgi:hypothetical protein
MDRTVDMSPSGTATMSIISITAICTMCMRGAPKNTSSKSLRQTPIGVRVSTVHADMNQPISTGRAAATKPSRMATTSIIWSTDACIIRMAITAMIMVRCLWFRTDQQGIA